MSLSAITELGFTPKKKYEGFFDDMAIGVYALMNLSQGEQESTTLCAILATNMYAVGNDLPRSTMVDGIRFAVPSDIESEEDNRKTGVLTYALDRVCFYAGIQRLEGFLDLFDEVPEWILRQEVQDHIDFMLECGFNGWDEDTIPDTIVADVQPFSKEEIEEAALGEAFDGECPDNGFGYLSD